jgi:cellulose synthase/poly-beta-1,6-N-acetylglucosamine synthase-like glycosyltransferase
MNDYLKTNLPFVSIIIPCRNEEKFIGKCLDSILAQNYPKEKMEILVVDGMSEDKTRKIVKKFQISNLEFQIHLLDNLKKFVPAAMNISIKSAQGNIIIRIDAHAWMAKNFISKNVEYLEKSDANCVGGPIKSINDDSFVGQTVALAMSSPFGVGDAKFRYSKKEEYVDTVAFGAYRREVFDNVGLFDEEFIRNEDDEFNFRLTKSGGKIFFTPKIESYYYVRSSISKLWKQYFQYGYFKIKLIKKFKSIPSLRCLIPTIFVASLFITGISGIFSFILLLLFYIISGAYLLFILTGGLILSMKNDNLKHFFILPLIFAIIHFSYGIGFLKGILDFVILKRDIKNIPLSR